MTDLLLTLGPMLPKGNSATKTDPPDGDTDEASENRHLVTDADYTHTTDDRVASTRSKQEVRTHAELAAAKQRDLPLYEGLSMRMRMAGQCENDQFPYSTDEYGKPLK